MMMLSTVELRNCLQLQLQQNEILNPEVQLPAPNGSLCHTRGQV